MPLVVADVDRQQRSVDTAVVVHGSYKLGHRKGLVNPHLVMQYRI